MSSSQCQTARQTLAPRENGRSGKPLSYGRDHPRLNTMWWSQTGSNRRPHACKARALPTELWPPKGATARNSTILADRPGHDLAVSQEWWAWEDLNFRPHAYQARALTN